VRRQCLRAQLAAVHILVHCPVSWVGRLNGSLLICLRKDVALCDTASLAGVEGTDMGDGYGRRIRETAHFMCAVLFQDSLRFIGGGRLKGSFAFCLRKDLALVSHCVLALKRLASL